MRIVFITNICTHYVAKLFEILSKEYNIDFYFTGGDERYWNKRNELHLGNIRGKYLKKFSLFSKIKIVPGMLALAFQKGDLVIKTIDGRFVLPFIFLVSKLQRRPFILWTGLWSHPQTLIHKVTYPFTKWIYHHSSAIVAYGEHVKKYLVALGVAPDKIFCAPHSTDNSILNKNVPQEQILFLRKKLGLASEKIILYVGRFEECKGLNYLIEGVSRIQDIDCRILFIGNGAQEDVLKEQCRASSVKSLFLGHISNQDLYQYYALADIFVLPSVTTKDFKEPWGIVVNEAMNQGCPVVTTDAVGVAAGGLVQDGENGFVVPEKNSLALTKAIEILLRDDDLRDHMGQAARSAVGQWGPEQTARGFFEAIEFVRVKKER